MSSPEGEGGRAQPKEVLPGSSWQFSQKDQVRNNQLCFSA